MLIQGSQTTTAAPPPGDYDTWADYMADELARHAQPDAEAQRGLKAMRLAPSLAVCRALLSGQRVPREALDPVWARRYRL